MMTSEILKMNPNDRFKLFVINDLMEKYNYSTKAAKKIFNNSYLPQLLIEDPAYVYHYESDYWAKELHKNYRPKISRRYAVLNGLTIQHGRNYQKKIAAMKGYK